MFISESSSAAWAARLSSVSRRMAAFMCRSCSAWLSPSSWVWAMEPPTQPSSSAGPVPCAAMNTGAAWLATFTGLTGCGTASATGFGAAGFASFTASATDSVAIAPSALRKSSPLRAFASLSEDVSRLRTAGWGCFAALWAFFFLLLLLLTTMKTMISI